ncbi:MAG: M4 family metallopeptidase, partial [Saprospiraceae bacterium]|nr:M4 family metallopeptidase [Saprospiraceae bacterium]
MLMAMTSPLTGQKQPVTVPGPYIEWVHTISLSEELGTPNRIALRASGGTVLNIDQAPEILEVLFQLENDDELRLDRIIPFADSLTVFRFQRFYRGVRVEHGLYAVLVNDREIKWINAEHYDLEAVDITPTMAEDQALSFALTQLDAELYAWEATEMLLQTHQDLPPQKRQALEALQREEFPEAELVIVRDFSTDEVSIDLAYKFVIESVTPMFRDEVYVHAHDGHIMLRDPQIKHGTGDTRYAGNRAFPTTEISPGLYELKGTDPVSGIYCDTRSLEGVGGLPLSVGALYTLASPIQDGDDADPCLLEDPPVGETGDDVWNKSEHRKALFGTLCCPTYTAGGSCNEYHNDDTALDAQWGAMVVARYWFDRHGRNSYDDDGADIYSFVHYGDAYDNAFWNGSYMTYGDGSYQGGTNPGGTFAPLSSMDVCAHEIGHAVCTSTSDLVYQREAGAMNEGFSDIWAAAIERYVLDSIDNSLPYDPFGIGEQIDEGDGGIGPGNPGTEALRWMDDPKAAGDPDTYGGANWVDPECPEPNLVNDYCGVHTNSGVLNKWFYLLSTGSGETLTPGSGKAAADDEINDLGDPYTVAALGFSKAEFIAFGGEVLLT